MPVSTSFGLDSILDDAGGIQLLEPQGYLDFLCLTSQAKVIVTDSGGLQEESTALGVPCLTMRANTERPVTCDEGTGTLIGSSAKTLREQFEAVLSGGYKRGQCPELWDGKAAERIVEVLVGGFSFQFSVFRPSVSHSSLSHSPILPLSHSPTPHSSLLTLQSSIFNLQSSIFPPPGPESPTSPASGGGDEGIADLG